MCMCGHAYVCVGMRTACVLVCVGVHACVCMGAFLCICMCVHEYMCVFACLCNLQVIFALHILRFVSTVSNFNIYISSAAFMLLLYQKFIIIEMEESIQPLIQQPKTLCLIIMQYFVNT